MMTASTGQSEGSLLELSQNQRPKMAAAEDEAVLEGVMEGASPKERLIELLLEQES